MVELERAASSSTSTRQLTLGVSRGAAVAWLLAGCLAIAAAIALFAWPHGWWILGALAVVLSQVLVIGAWRDARFGTLANALLLIGVLYGALTQGPTSFRAAFDREAARVLTLPLETPTLTEADLAPLPAPVQRYLRATGFVGQPRVRNYQLRFRGRIRSDPSSPWMPFEAAQVSNVDPPTRLFLMDATMSHLPVQAFHHLVDGAATMRVRLAGALQIVDARGPQLDRSESVTLLNDLCLLAPGALVDPSITWEAIDDRTARARLRHGAHTISATLSFGADGLLADFSSDDRARASADGSQFAPMRFTTPVRDYRAYGAYRLASFGEGRWHPPEGAYAYGEFELLEVAYNVRRPD